MTLIIGPQGRQSSFCLAAMKTTIYFYCSVLLSVLGAQIEDFVTIEAPEGPDRDFCYYVSKNPIWPYEDGDLSVNYAKHECFGSLAALLGIVSSLPQIYKTFTTKDARSFSLVALFIGFIRSILWILHGYYMKSYSGMASSSYGLFYGICNYTGIFWIFSRQI